MQFPRITIEAKKCCTIINCTTNTQKQIEAYHIILCYQWYQNLEAKVLNTNGPFSRDSTTDPFILRLISTDSRHREV